MLCPDLSRLVRVCPTGAGTNQDESSGSSDSNDSNGSPGPAIRAVLGGGNAPLVAAILAAINADDYERACNTARIWCNRVSHTNRAACDADGPAWLALTRAVFPHTIDPYPWEPQGEKDWFFYICNRQENAIARLKTGFETEAQYSWHERYMRLERQNSPEELELDSLMKEAAMLIERVSTYCQDRAVDVSVRVAWTAASQALDALLESRKARTTFANAPNGMGTLVRNLRHAMQHLKSILRPGMQYSA